MNLEAELVLSYYKEVAQVNKKHRVTLVQHVEMDSFYVKKILSAYDLNAYDYIKNHSHKGLPQIIEIIKDDDRLIVIEEYINGKSLRSILDENGLFDEKKTVEIIEQLCDVLYILHTANPPVIHRDIKPSNLIISNDGVLKLIDFNAAKMVKYQENQDTVLMGTAGYAAPEQYGFAPSNISTDVYAIGVLMNELLTGKLPSQEIYKGKLEPIIHKCLQLDSKKRYLNVMQLKKVLMNCKTDAFNDSKVENWQQSWLPPGFRSKKTGRILCSLLVYFLIITSCFMLEVEDVPINEVWPYRLFCLLMLLTIILFVGNYRNIQSRFLLMRSKSLPIRIIGIVLWSIVISIVYAIILQIVII